MKTIVNSFKPVSLLSGVFSTKYLGLALTGGQGINVKDVDEQSRQGIEKSKLSDEAEETKEEGMVLILKKEDIIYVLHFFFVKNL